jgi:hypothetical protein
MGAQGTGETPCLPTRPKIRAAPRGIAAALRKYSAFI